MSWFQEEAVVDPGNYKKQVPDKYSYVNISKRPAIRKVKSEKSTTDKPTALKSIPTVEMNQTRYDLIFFNPFY